MAVSQASLPNGLKVILKPVRHVPIVSTWLWYRVGSRNEVEGLTGLSHWVEHMMFKGSPAFPKGSIMRTVDRHGGYVNAMTSHDFTAYYATLPSEAADLALQIEADRMTGALFDPAEVEAERTVIISEREGGENEPSYVLAEEVSAAAFREHPYHHQTIGWKQDLLAISRDDLYRHYRQHYAPNNAVLVAVGDLDPDAWLARITELFGGIAPSAAPRSLARAEAPQRGERRVMVRRPGSTPLVRISYHTPPVAHADYLPLVVADAVLSGGKAMFAFEGSQARSSRLYRALVETELASSASSSYHASLDPYLFTVGATVREGVDPQRVERAVLDEIDKLRQELVSTDELAVAIRQTQAQFAYSAETVTSQALTLGFLEIVDHYERMNTVLAELAQVTREDVLRVAQTYLVTEESVVGVFIPTGDGGEEADGDADSDEAALLPCAIETSRFLTGALGPDTVTRHVLSNGIVALVHENHASPTVSIAGDLLPGAIHEPAERLGLASLTASMLRRGSVRYSHQEINKLLDGVSASISFNSGRDDSGFDGRSLAGDVDLLLDLLAEMIVQPAFAEVELQRLRGQVLTQIGELNMDTEYRAERAFEAALYGDTHPYGRTEVGTRETVSAITCDDLAAFHARYHPSTLVLTVVGDVETSRTLKRIEALLGDWHSEGPAPVWQVPSVTLPTQPIECREQVPGKSQGDLVLGVLGMPRYAEGYFPAAVANTILGRLGLMGRLGDVVRDQQGLAYYVASELDPGRGQDPWIVYAGVNLANLDRAVRSIQGELARMREELVTPDELRDCQTYLVGSLPLHLESNHGVARFLLNVEQYRLGLDYMMRYPELVRSVTREQVRDVMQRFWPADRYVIAIAGTFRP